MDISPGENFIISFRNLKYTREEKMMTSFSPQSYTRVQVVQSSNSSILFNVTIHTIFLFVFFFSIFRRETVNLP